MIRKVGTLCSKFSLCQNFHNVKCWRYSMILDMKVCGSNVSSSQYSETGSCECGIFSSSYFRIVGAGGRVCYASTWLLLVRLLMYIICPCSGRNGHIVAKHIAYSHYIYHPQTPNLQQYVSKHRKDPFSRHSKSTNSFSCLQQPNL